MKVGAGGAHLQAPRALPEAMSLTGLAEKLQRAHAAARIGHVAEARALLGEIESLRPKSDEIITSVGMLHYLTRDAARGSQASSAKIVFQDQSRIGRHVAAAEERSASAEGAHAEGAAAETFAIDHP
jgi:hypothetical protein